MIITILYVYVLTTLINIMLIGIFLNLKNFISAYNMIMNDDEIIKDETFHSMIPRVLFFLSFIPLVQFWMFLVYVISILNKNSKLPEIILKNINDEINNNKNG